jgi:hypothetical protein
MNMKKESGFGEKGAGHKNSTEPNNLMPCERIDCRSSGAQRRGSGVAMKQRGDTQNEAMMQRRARRTAWFAYELGLQSFSAQSLTPRTAVGSLAVGIEAAFSPTHQATSIRPP